MLEKQIESAVVKYAKLKDILSFKMNSVSSRGLPDRIFISKLGIFFVEFKRKNAKTTKLQNYMIEQLLRHDCKVFIVDDIKTGQDLINSYVKLK